MIIPPKLGPPLLSVGYFTSALGGSPKPSCITDRNLYFELLTEGAVYGFEAEPVLHGVGTVFVHRPGDCTISKTQGATRYRCLTALFEWDASQDLIGWPRSFLWYDTKAVLQFADEMLSSYHHEALDRSVIGAYIWNQFRFRLEASKRVTQNNKIPARLKAVMVYLDTNFGNAISVDEAAAHVGLSASHLHARFREYLGETPHQYLIRTRMRAAAHLLVSSDRPIKVVASEVGYVNTESFCRAFKKYHGRTAASHRGMYRRYD